MDSAPTIEQPSPAAPTRTRTPCGTVAILTPQDDGTFVTLVWDVPIDVASQGITQLITQFGPARTEITADAQAAAVSADFFANRHGVVRIDND
ncbi:hypothetical protein [Streptosporangium sp. CA-115845]|uniref:hypothetical protein n=1 Tax=Streptosporangium sp. CA-115845 TaxID=3240071 RepID=UPI003D8CC97D